MKKQPANTFRSAAAPPLLLVLVFIATRLWFAHAGGAYIAKSLHFAKQFLDPALLEGNLLRSLWYLHAQPPLFNLFLGLVLKLAPDPPRMFALCFQAAGMLVPLCLYGTLLLLGIRRWIALSAALVFMLNPALILYENLLYYTHVEGVLIMAAVFFLARWGAKQKTFDLAAFWLALVCLGLTRSLFHPAFFLVLALGMGLVLRHQGGSRTLQRRFAAVSALAMVPLLAWCLKNLLIFGFFGTSSWAGMSLWIKTNGYAPEQLDEFYARGLISKIALRTEFEPFQPIADYTRDGLLVVPPCHHPSDCQELRPGGKPNYNNIGYVALSKQLGRDALHLIRHDPALFRLYTAGAYSLTLWYASDSVHALFQDNMAIVEPLERLYRFLYFGFLGVQNKHSDPRLWLRTACISALFVFFYGLTIMQVFRKHDRPNRRAAVLVCLFCMLVHAFVLATSSLIEFGENNRFRFPVDGAFLVLMAGNIMLLRKKTSAIG